MHPHTASELARFKRDEFEREAANARLAARARIGPRIRPQVQRDGFVRRHARSVAAAATLVASLMFVTTFVARAVI